MRRASLLGGFLFLVAALVALWMFRFERCPANQTWRFSDLRAVNAEAPGLEWMGTPENPVLRVRVDGETPRVAVRWGIPGIRPVRFLHLRFRMASQPLVPGGEKWEDGRFLIEWHRPGETGEPETDAAGSIQQTTGGTTRHLVIDAKKWPALPAIRIEHLGKSGEFELAELEITPVRERALWRVGRWFLALGWAGWLFCVIRSWPGIPKWRAWCAAGILVAMGIFFVFPGPWHSARPMGERFFLGEGRPAQAAGTATGDAVPVDGEILPGVKKGVIPPLGKLPERGSLILRIKMKIVEARPLLHALLLFGPTLCMAWLVGRRPAMWLAILLSLSIESGQLAFGYGFDWQDVQDLVSNAVGIAFALWIYGKLPLVLRGMR